MSLIPYGGISTRDEIEESTTEHELLTYYQNAAATDCGSLGHGKGHRNEILAEKYADKLRSMGVEVPDYYEAAELGEYNGPGAG